MEGWTEIRRRLHRSEQMPIKVLAQVIGVFVEHGA